jgi:hypothetical protein
MAARHEMPNNGLCLEMKSSAMNAQSIHRTVIIVNVRMSPTISVLNVHCTVSPLNNFHPCYTAINPATSTCKAPCAHPTTEGLRNTLRWKIRNNEKNASAEACIVHSFIYRLKPELRQQCLTRRRLSSGLLRRIAW